MIRKPWLQEKPQVDDAPPPSMLAPSAAEIPDLKENIVRLGTGEDAIEMPAPSPRFQVNQTATAPGPAKQGRPLKGFRIPSRAKQQIALADHAQPHTHVDEYRGSPIQSRAGEKGPPPMSFRERGRAENK